MTVQASIKIVLSKEYDPLELIEGMISYGWSHNFDGRLTYIPLSDIDCFDWKIADTSEWDNVKAIIRKKIEKCEPIGIILVWMNSFIGGEFLFYPQEKKILIALSVNRATVSDGRQTDFDWYSERLGPFLIRLGYSVEEFKTFQLE